MTSLCMMLQQLNKTGIDALLEQCIIDKSKLTAWKAQVASQKEKSNVTDVKKGLCNMELIELTRKLQNKQTEIDLINA